MALQAKDLNGLSDPYLKIYLEPSKKIKFKTRTLHKTLNPVYNEAFVFKVLNSHVSLRIEIFDILFT